MIDPSTGKKLLTQEDYEWAAKELGCEVEAIKAVALVEGGNKSGFQKQRDGTVAPLILFEKHWFGRYTNYKYNSTHPDISSKKWQPKSYGSSLNQHIRLQKAAQLDREAALKSCSWGKFQLMGGEYEQNGYKSLQEFINAMYRSEFDHLDGFVRYIKRKPGLLPAIRNKDWARFAYLYNGSGYKLNSYDTKMRDAYNKFKKS